MQQTVDATPESQKPNRLPFIVGAIGLVIVALSGWALYAMSLSTQLESQRLSLTTTDSQLPSTTQVNPVTPSETDSTLSGSLQRIDRDLNLFVPTKQDALNPQPVAATYYDAGTFTDGQYRGYTRIIAVRDSGGAAGIYSYTLATQDFQSYVLDDSDGLFTIYAEDDWNYPYNFIDESKISDVVVLDTQLPKEIVLNPNFSLYREEYPTEYFETDQTDQWNNPLYLPLITTDFSDFQVLESPISTLRMFTRPYEQSTDYYDQLSDEEKQAFQVRDQYFDGSTQVLVIDSTGLPRYYSLTHPQTIPTYEEGMVKFAQELERYKQANDASDGLSELPYPSQPSFPGMGFPATTVIRETAASNQQLFTQYEVAIPEACTFSTNTRVVNLNDEDLERVGTMNGGEVFRLKDENHPLYVLQYDTKFAFYEWDAEFWQEQNKNLPYLSQAAYVAKVPLLFMKDYWNRWVAVGEYDYLIPGGCGKPVIYLYPEQPTEVQLSFLKPIQFETDIPKYRDGWHVLAQPNGQLTDLQPEATDCSQLDATRFGSEYAESACKSRSYPYLYWSGNSNSGAYPSAEEGWIVKRAELSSFFDDKLAVMGFTAQEINDFKEYWVPTMSIKDAPYFKISFFQTQQVNQLFPMAVQPRPDSILRMFMDYTPLTSKPERLPVPQQFQPVQRTGFTLVEWGGVK